jgi:predicted kinase
MKTEGGGPRLIIVCGLPGAGKTMRAKQLERALHAVRFCPDDWMEQLGIDVWDEARRAKIEASQWNLGQQLLTFGLTVIIEWGTWGRSERDALRLGARALGATVELHYVSAPIDVLFDRIQRRGIEDPPITREQVQRLAEIIEVPTPEEMALYDEPSPQPSHLILRRSLTQLVFRTTRTRRGKRPHSGSSAYSISSAKLP